MGFWDSLISGLIVFFGVAVLICVIAILLAFPTMWLWNWLMPDIFRLTTITLWQALGLLLLSGFLFGSSWRSTK